MSRRCAEIVGELPKKSIDTGMGLERIAAVMQGVTDNYDTDIFKALIAASGALTHTPTDGANTASHRVIADHLRTSGFLVADGVLPANEGRGYVLRRIMRRAMRHAHILGAKEPLMHRLVPALVAEMGAAYPELFRAQPLIEATLQQEETRFRQTLDKGLKLLDEATAGMKPGDTLAGDTAFRLYDTYGFPYDLTEDALRTQDLTVDRAGFDTAMAEQKRAARARRGRGSGAKASDDLWFDIVEATGATEFTGYAAETGEGEVVALIKEWCARRPGDDRRYRRDRGQPDAVLRRKRRAGRRYRYDQRRQWLAGHRYRDIEATGPRVRPPRAGRCRCHRGRRIPVKLTVDAARRGRIRANHSATHLLHEALRQRLGLHVAQKGSLVAPDRLRFDVSHPTAMSAAELADAEAAVNAQIRGNGAVVTRLMTPDDAIGMGAMALFGEKYGDEVRVVSMGTDGDETYSIELCGGTHVGALGDIGLFKVIGEGGGVVGHPPCRGTDRRGRARLSGRPGCDAARSRRGPEVRARRRADAGRCADRGSTSTGARACRGEEERLRWAVRLRHRTASGDGQETVGGLAFSRTAYSTGSTQRGCAGRSTITRQRIGSGIVAIVAVNDGRASVAVGVSDDLVARHNAVDLLRLAVGGTGRAGRGWPTRHGAGRWPRRDEGGGQRSRPFATRWPRRSSREARCRPWGAGGDADRCPGYGTNRPPGGPCG